LMKFTIPVHCYSAEETCDQFVPSNQFKLNISQAP
jgi:hypothetical protein